MITKDHEKLLQIVYYKHNFLFGRDKLFQYIKNNYESYPTRREVMEWLKNQEVYQLHVRPSARVSTKSIVVKRPNSYYQCDLVGPLPRDQGYNYIFSIIDVASKMLYTAPLKTKTAAEVANTLDKIISDNKLHISVIQSDNGLEFHGEFQNLLKEHNIKQIFSQPASPWTNGVIERSHSTWKQMIYKYWTITNTKKWKDILPTFVKNINNSFNRSIGMTPLEASSMEPDLLKKQLIRNSVKIDDPKVLYKVGDHVRLRLRNDNKLEKAKQYFTNDMFRVSRVVKGSKTQLMQYQLKDKSGNTIKGYFNESDLLDGNISEKPPITLQRHSNYALPLPIRGQVEVDRLRQNKDLRPASVRGEYVVEAILDSRKKRGSREYLIKWSSYPLSMSTWEPLENLTNAKDLLEKFHQVDPQVISTRQKWLDFISEYTGKELNDFPRGFHFKWVQRKNNSNIIDYYLNIDQKNSQKTSVIRSIPDLKKHLKKM
jgi:hypothetical protein